MHTRILQAPYSLVRRAKRVIAREVRVPEEPVGTAIVVASTQPESVDSSLIVVPPAEVPPPDAVIMPGELGGESRERTRSHRRPRYRLAQVCCILSAVGSGTALVGMALEEGPLAKISAGVAVLTAVGALAFAWRSRMKSRVVEWALAAGAVALLIAAAVMVLGDGPRNTEPQGKPATVSPGQRQQQG